MSQIIKQQKEEVYRLRGDVEQAQTFCLVSLAAPDEVVACQKNLVEYLLFQILGQTKESEAKKAWQLLNSDEQTLSETERIVYWDGHIKTALKLVQKKWAKA